MNSSIKKIKNIFWPIDGIEHKKFVPMALMMFCILFNYSMFRSIKDGFVVPDIGAEAVSFIKTYIVLPLALMVMVLYSKLSNSMSRKGVFYTITIGFLSYLTLFTFVLYPYQDLIHPSKESVQNLISSFPRLKWFFLIYGNWSLASFYAVAELWGSVMLSLLFWQFANQTTQTSEAKRFYSMYGVLGNLGLPFTSFVLDLFLSDSSSFNFEHKFTPVLSLGILSGLVVLFIYSWINNNVLTDERLYIPSNKSGKKSKVKLSLKESLKFIFSSKYVGLLALLVIAYGVSINLIEGVWKAKVKEMYPTKEAYTVFMGRFQSWQGWTTIFFMFVGTNILRKVSWSTAAILTPLMILVTGLAFFMFIFVDDVNKMGIETGAMVMATNPLLLVVTIGMIQNVLSKATKYSLFDSTKEMAYIPLDEELRTKGKAAIDVVGGRLGKSGGGVIQSTFFMVFKGYSFAEATPYFAAIFFITVISWLYSVRSLSKLYKEKLQEIENKQ